MKTNLYLLHLQTTLERILIFSLLFFFCFTYFDIYSMEKFLLLLFCFCLFISSALPPRGSAPYTNFFEASYSFFFNLFIVLLFLCLEDF